MRTRTKKLIAGLGALALSVTTAGHLAFAQSTDANIELAQLLPADVDQLIEFNTAVSNPFSGAMDSFLTGFTSGMSDISNANTQVKDILLAELKSNKVSLATKSKMVKSDYGDYSYPMSENYASLHMSQENFNKLVSFLPSTVTKETVDGTTVYSSSSDFYMAMVGNLVVATSTHDRMVMLLDMYTHKTTGTTLAQTAGYMAVRQKDLPGSFLNMYINPAQYQNLTGMDDMIGLNGLMAAQKDLLAAVQAEGFSVGQTDKGFNFSVLVKGDNAKLTQLNLNFDRYNFVPELYKYVNSQNIMLFGEESNLQAKVNDTLKLFASDAQATQQFTDWKNTLKSQGNVDFDNEVLPLFTGKYTISVHKTSQIYPAVTMIFDVRNMTDKAATVLTKLVDYADKSFNQLEKDQGVDFYNRGIASAGGTSFYEMTFDPTKLPDADAGLKNLGSDRAKINIHAAVTNQGFLIITNAPNVSDVYATDGKGMLNNATFSAALTAPQEMTGGLGYLSIDAVQDYANLMMDTFSAPAEAKEFFSGLLDPWHDIYTKSYATSDSTWATGFVNVDTAGLAAYGDLFQKYYSLGTSTDYTDYQPAARNFCDVHDSDWFAPYVNDLSKDYIVNGYEDGCFRPGNDITRAEFVKMMIVAKGSYDIEGFNPAKKYFTDVNSNDAGDEWYREYVNNAGAANYVSGYEDGSFRPNEKITRAEAVQILFNMSDKLKNAVTANGSSQFMDVHAGDWFGDAVQAAYTEGLVNGVSTLRFEPNRNINRAEAAKIIKLFRDLEMGGTAGAGM